MRLVASLVLGLLALATPSHALSASSTLAKLSARVAAAEQALIQIQSQSHVQDMPAPTAAYTFNGGYYTDINSANAATKNPSGATNIQIVNNNARTNMVLQRSASNSQTNSKLIIPKGLSSQFTTGVWISWGQTQGGTILASGGFSLSITSAGIVSANAGGLTVTDPTAVVDSSWTHYAVTYDGSFLALYRNGKDPAVATAENGIAFTPTSTLAVGNNEAGTSGYVGSIDDVRIYNTALESVEVGFVYSETNFGATKGAATIQSGSTRWWGHIGTDTKVRFNNRIASQPTYGITITNTFIDADFRTSNLFWVRMSGVTGPAITQGVYVPGVGTVTWDPPTYILIIQPETAVPQGQSFTYTIPYDKVPLNNPTVANAATSSDARWQVAMTLDPDQTGGRRQGLRWQAITYTPATIDPNPALVEESASYVGGMPLVGGLVSGTPLRVGLVQVSDSVNPPPVRIQDENVHPALVEESN